MEKRVHKMRYYQGELCVVVKEYYHDCPYCQTLIQCKIEAVDGTWDAYVNPETLTKEPIHG